MVREWGKSSYSQKEHVACVEVGSWHKASYSYDVGACVEVGGLEAVGGLEVGVRDTENRHLGHLAFGAGEFAALIGGVR